MIARMLFYTATMASLAMVAPWAAAQVAEKPSVSAATGLDAAPSSGAPDPLTPLERDGPPPPAPGAPAIKAEEPPAPPPVAEVDPLAAAILAKASHAGGHSDARDDIAGLAAYYSGNGGHPIWTTRDGFLPQAQKAMREIRDADDWGLEASAFALPSVPSANASPEALADAEIKLSLAVLKYARHARGGRVDPPSISEVIDRRPHIYDPKSVLAAIAAADSADGYLRSLHPKHEQFKKLRQLLVSMNRGGATGGGGSAKIPAGPDFRPGDSHPQITALRHRLNVPPEGEPESYYDEGLLAAVNRYQREHGLEVTGIIDRRLRASLNQDGVSSGGAPDEKKMRIIVNMERWRWMPDELGSFYVWDSIPEQLTRVVDHGRVTLLEKIVVGKPVTPTPTFTANMQFIVFHPEWGVPDGIKVNEIAPKLRRSSGFGGGEGGFPFFGGGGGGGSSEVLQRMGGLRVSLNGRPVDPDSVDWSNVDIRRFQFIQGAGTKNVLGVVKFRFPNKHDVYMHDTPDRQLFGAAPRAFSHGCMRTQNPVHLAEVLLAHDKGYSPEQVRAMVDSGATNEIKLSTQFPVHVAYFTVEVDEEGKVRYLSDIYGLDSRVATALKGQPVRFASDPVIAEQHVDTTGPDRDRDDRSARSRDRSRYRPYGQRPGPFWGGGGGFLDWN